MPDQVQYFNRYTQQIETEAIYGEGALRFAYENPVGRFLLHALVKWPWFSRFYGWRMDRPSSKARVLPFIEKFRLDPSEFADPPTTYRTFNEFFYRKLKPEARPIAADPNVVVFPADGRHLGFPDASQADGIFVKGQHWNLGALLGDPVLAEKYRHGTLILSRLCPVDYHRFHFPVSGTPGEVRLVNGPLFSVNPIALRRSVGYLWQNKRTLTELRTEKFGTVLLMEIGATNVGSIVQTFVPNRSVAKGAEKGHFAFGGSSTLTLFEPGRITLADDLVRETAQRRELYAHMGDVMARL